MVMIIRSQGRLGNQLFLWSAAAEKRRLNELIILVGFVELKKFFTHRPPSVAWLPLGHAFDRRIKKLFQFICQMFGGRAVGRVIRKGPPSQLERSSGYLPVWIFDAGLCQSDLLAPVRHVVDFWTPPALRANGHDGDPCSTVEQKVDYAFVHVRRGDYADFSTFGREVALPVSWYIEQMKEIRLHNQGIVFKVLSDDYQWASSNFGGLQNVDVISTDSHQAFEVMASATHGVLSPSSFSWWAARLAFHRRGGTFIAPTYWLGYAAREWYPDTEIQSAFLVYRDVV